MFCACWLGNVLRATTACTFSTPQLPKAVRTWGAFSFFTCKCAFRHNGEPGVFCTFWLRNVPCATSACNFSSLICPAGSAPAALASLLFDPPEPQIIGKTQCLVTFLPFRAPGSSFFWHFLCLIFFLLLFSPLLFFDSYHLRYSSVHTVGSLTSDSKLSFDYILYISNRIYTFDCSDD